MSTQDPNLQIEKSENKKALAPLERISEVMLSPKVKSRFEAMMGPGASYYLNQAMVVIANNRRLQECDLQSIYLSVMRAATLRLSLDPAQGQAWLINYGGHCTFQPGYKGIYDLAQRTHLYRFINVVTVYEGEEVIENRMTGLHVINPHIKRTSDKPAGYMLYFELIYGFKKTFYMTVTEIEMHAQTYNPKGYRSPDSPWNSNDGREREKMMKKTVLSNGLRQWGVFNQGDLDLLKQAEDEQGWTGDVDIIDPDLLGPGEPEAKPTEAQIMNDLGFPSEPGQVPPAKSNEAGEGKQPAPKRKPEKKAPASPEKAAAAGGGLTLAEARKKNWADGAMAFDMASKVGNTAGLFIDQDVPALKEIIKTCTELLKKPGLDEKTSEELTYNRAAASACLAATPLE